MNTNTVRLFDHNDNLVPNFDEEIEKILISVHGENYYDVDEELVNTNFIPTQNEIYKDEELEKTMEIVEDLTKDSKKIVLVEKDKNKSKFLDFVPVLFFVLLFLIIVIAGYYFLNHIDLTSFIK